MSGETPTTNRGRRWPWRRPSGLALVLAGLVYGAANAWVLADDVDLGDGHWAALIGVTAAAWWALALLFDDYGGPGPAALRARNRGLVVSVFAWLILVALLRTTWMRLDVPPQLLGLTDRVLLAPVVVLAVVWLGRALQLRGWVTVIAALVVVGGLLREGERFGWPQETVSAAGAPDLAAARKSGRVIGLLSLGHDHNSGVRTPPRRAGMRCQRITGTDAQRTLVGAAGRQLELRAEACWLKDGTPFTVQVVAFAAARDARADPLTTQVTALDPFTRDEEPRPATALVTPKNSSTGGVGGASISAFSGDGSVRIGGRVGPVTLRVSPDGRAITLVTGWLAIDPLVRELDDRGLATIGGARAYDQSFDGPERPASVALGFHPARNEVLDVFRARFSFDGDPDGSLERLRPRGRKLLALLGRSSGFQRRGDLLLDEARLTHVR